MSDKKNPPNNKLPINRPQSNEPSIGELLVGHSKMEEHDVTPNSNEEIYANLDSIYEIPYSSKWGDSYDEIFRIEKDPPLPSESVFKYTKDTFLDEWSEEPFDTKMMTRDIPYPYFLYTPLIFLNGDLLPKKRRLLVEEDM